MNETDPEREPERLADELEAQADRLERESGQLEGKIKSVREDWKRKRQDPGVPGAIEPEEDEDGSTNDAGASGDASEDDAQHEPG
jgi:hypothetical protein